MEQFWSYASNFEDVLLKRCFPETTDGFYIDIGAHHPVNSSVTKAFYDLGWSGINVEPGEIFSMLDAERPRDINLNCAVTDFEGEAPFFVHTRTALSSLNSEGAEGNASIIPVTTLPALIDRYAPAKHINFLKIDAEGSEEAIIRAADWTRHRPEVLIIESTEPFKNIRRAEQWQGVLESNGYIFAYFDGVNDFFVREESKELLDCFKLPVNQLDDFFFHSPQFGRVRKKAMELEKEVERCRSVIADLEKRLNLSESRSLIPKKKPRVVYFTAVPLGDETSGGMLVCREHVKLLASLEDIDLCVFSIRSGDEDFLASLGVKHFSTEFVKARAPKIKPYSFRPRHRWPFMWELRAEEQKHLDRNFCQFLDDFHPDVVVVDYLPSAIWVPTLYRLPVPKITITLNREGDFHRESRLMGRLQEAISSSPIAEWRMRRFENSIYRKSAAVVTLTKNDIPDGSFPSTEMVVIPPILEKRQPPWQYAANKEIFFVGNIAHYPNYQAIDWLANRFSPELEKRDPDARIIVIGASEEDLPADWSKPNIEFRGTGAKEDVVERFTSSDLFMVPISNTFGSKTKILECLAHGAPLLSTKEALTGLPFAELVPQFELDSPDRAAEAAVELLNDGERLQALGHELASQVEPARAASRRIWDGLVHRVANTIPHRWFRQPRIIARVENKLRYMGEQRRREAATSEIEIAVLPNYKVAVTGAHPIEIGIGKHKRWTEGKAEFEVELGKFKPKTLKLKITAHGPPGGREVSIFANEEQLFADRLKNRPFTGEFPLPDLNGEKTLRITIDSTPFQDPNSRRTLGVGIESLLLRG
ncbi:FkbM family methyltransferase [Methyloligella solikamskensis]|uniref:FkbM family methyltransferase n=1 Tax=Methyloligella solikamskensis TaxID=1177756 RepID=A0ABW3JBA9_9HYPH